VTTKFFNHIEICPSWFELSSIIYTAQLLLCTSFCNAENQDATNKSFATDLTLAIKVLEWSLTVKHWESPNTCMINDHEVVRVYENLLPYITMIFFAHVQTVTSGLGQIHLEGWFHWGLEGALSIFFQTVCKRIESAINSLGSKNLQFILHMNRVLRIDIKNF